MRTGTRVEMVGIVAKLSDGRTVVGALAVLEAPTTLGCCDLCADVGISTPATHEGRLPGGMWAALCAAHAYRARSAGHIVVADEAAELEHRRAA